MSEAMRLLNDLAYDTYSDADPINDVLIINANGRITNVPGSEMLLGVETDHDVERKYFKCPKIVGDNVDLSKLSLRVHFKNANGEKDKYIVEDVAVNGDYITFSWLLSDKVLAYKGEVAFTVVAVKTGEEGKLTKCWNTTLAKGTVLEGLYVKDLDEYEEEQARDVLAQLLGMLGTQKDESIAEIQNEAAKQMQNVTNKGAEVLATIPADYTEMDATVKQHTNDIYDLQRTKACAIVEEVVSDVIYVTDAAEQPPVELSLFGRTEQSEYTEGYQLFDASKIKTTTAAGATVTNNGDGSFTITGSGSMTGTLSARYAFSHEDSINLLKAGTLTLSTGVKSYPYAFVQIIVGASNVASCTNINATTSSLEVKEEYLADDSMYMEIGLYGVADFTIVPTTIKPMLYQDGDGTWERFSGGKPGPNPEYPFEMVNIENPVLEKCGKNMITYTTSTKEIAGVKFKFNDDGSITADGTATETAALIIDNKTPVHCKGVDLIASLGSSSGKVSMAVGYHRADDTVKDTLARTSKQDAAFVYPDEAYSTRTYIFVTAGTTCTKEVVYPMVRLKGASSEFEKPETKQTISLPYELNGIDITNRDCRNRANYIDSNGRLYYGDEIDLNGGILRRCLKELVLDGSRTYHINTYMNNNYGRYVYGTYVSDLSDKYYTAPIIADKLRVAEWDALVPDDYVFIVNNTIFISLADQSIDSVEALQTYLTENPITVLYAPTEPTEIALTEDEIAAYRQVRMSNPITTLYNSVGAPIKLKYGCDTKMYVGTHGGGGGSINPDDLVDYVTKTEFETALDEIIAIQEALIGGDA